MDSTYGGPPPTPPAAGGLTSTTPYRSGPLRAQVAVFLLGVSIVTALFAPLISYMQVAFPDALAGGDADAQVETGNTSTLIVGLLMVAAGLSMIAVFIATVVAFSMWIHRAYANLPALGNPKEGLEYSPRWAVGGFFIPIVNLFVPYRAVKEIWVKSDPAVRDE